MTEEHEQTADDNGHERPVPQGQMMAQIVMNVEPGQIPGQEKVGLELRLANNISNRLEFLLTVAQIALEGAKQERLKERMGQPQIQVPKIQLPPGFDPRSRGKGRGGRR